MTVFILIDVEDFTKRVVVFSTPLELYQGRVHVEQFFSAPIKTFVANVGSCGEKVMCEALRVEDRNILYRRMP